MNTILTILAVCIACRILDYLAEMGQDIYHEK
jgi:hypothetical protein